MTIMTARCFASPRPSRSAAMSTTGDRARRRPAPAGCSPMRRRLRRPFRPGRSPRPRSPRPERRASAARSWTRCLPAGRSPNPGAFGRLIPDSSGEFHNPNNHSLVIRVDYGAASFLFTGGPGACRRSQGCSTATRQPRLDVDVYVAGHHGADNGTTLQFLNAMTPELAVISMGPPHADRRKERLEARPSAAKHRRAAREGDQHDRRAAPISAWSRRARRPFMPLDHPLRDAIYGTGWDGDIVVSAGRRRSAAGRDHSLGAAAPHFDCPCRPEFAMKRG